MEELICKEGKVEEEKKASETFTSMFEVPSEKTRTNEFMDNAEFAELLNSQLSKKKDDHTPAYMRINPLKRNRN